MNARRRAFAQNEPLIVLTIIAFLASLLLAAWSSAKKRPLRKRMEPASAVQAAARQELAAPSPRGPAVGYRLAWSDDFDGTALDTNKWSHWLPGKRRDAVNTSNAVSLTNGLLTITSYTESGQHFTGMISTRGKFAPVRGWWEARLRFEESPGMWSAFWLQSPTMGRPIGDPAMAGIEIDICEHRSADKNGSHIAGKVAHNLHWDGYGRAHKTAGHDTRDLGLGEGFHVYGFEWTTNAYRFFVDGELTWTVTNAISNAKEFCILSSEIDGKAWAGKIPEAGYGELAASKTKMIVDWVRYYTRE